MHVKGSLGEDESSCIGDGGTHVVVSGGEISGGESKGGKGRGVVKIRVQRNILSAEVGLVVRVVVNASVPVSSE